MAQSQLADRFTLKGSKLKNCGFRYTGRGIGFRFPWEDQDGRAKSLKVGGAGKRGTQRAEEGALEKRKPLNLLKCLIDI